VFTNIHDRPKREVVATCQVQSGSLSQVFTGNSFLEKSYSLCSLRVAVPTPRDPRVGGGGGGGPPSPFVSFFVKKEGGAPKKNNFF